MPLALGAIIIIIINVMIPYLSAGDGLGDGLGNGLGDGLGDGPHCSALIR